MPCCGHCLRTLRARLPWSLHVLCMARTPPAPGAPLTGPPAPPRPLGTPGTQLWVVRCAEGAEREAVVCLQQKCYDLAKKGTPLLIKAAFCQDHLKVGQALPCRRRCCWR